MSVQSPNGKHPRFAEGGCQRYDWNKGRMVATITTIQAIVFREAVGQSQRTQATRPTSIRSWASPNTKPFEQLPLVGL